MPENNQKNNKDKHDSLPSGKEDGLFVSKLEYNELRAKAQKAEENLDRYLRAQAEFENIKKRMERQSQDFIKFANEGIIIELLNILDDLERTIEVAQSKHQDLSVFLKGVEMIFAHLYDMLKAHGVAPIEAEGKIFDPHCHEALVQVENPSLPEHTVVEELQKGYLLCERVIRTAKVKISKKAVKENNNSIEKK